MFRKFHEKRKSEEGFTLIELLVVILIIAILAAIAIPVFLRQREKGWRSQMESALKNAATAQESFATANNGKYTASTALLNSEGFKKASDVTVNITSANLATTYCMTATHANLAGETYSISSASGAPSTAGC